MATRNNSVGNLDWFTLSLYLALVVVGWLMIYSVGYTDDGDNSIFNFSTNAGKQLMFIGASFVTILICYLIDANFWQTFALLVFGITMALLLLVIPFGVTIKGATSWFRVAGFTLQPSEFAKFGTAVAVSSYLSRFNFNPDNLRSVLPVFGLFVLPMLLIMLQPDAGSALVFTSFLIVLFRAGLNALLYAFGIGIVTLLVFGLVFPPLNIVLGLLILLNIILVLNLKNQKLIWGGVLAGSGIVSIALAYLGLGLPALGIQAIVFIICGWNVYNNRKGKLIGQVASMLAMGTIIVFSANYFFNEVLESHQQDRINVWLQPSKCDPKGALYNVIQSKMTIGSGGLKGKGFLEGTFTKLNYVPEQATDFIFCTIGEEQGFIGVFGIVILFLLLIMRIITLAERQRTTFARYFCYSVASILFVHVFINIGMTMGLVPIIGIPLPFISSGGSSILGFSLMIGVLLKLDSSRMSRARR